MKTIIAFKSAISPGTPPGLGPGPRGGVFTQEEVVNRVRHFLDSTSVNTPKPGLVEALALLWNDHLEAAHELSQIDLSSDGSFIHAIMHRREPDFSNAKYWWRRTGMHPALRTLALKAAGIIEKNPLAAEDMKPLIQGSEWKSNHFVDLCERVSLYPQDPLVPTLIVLQELETDALLEHLLLD